MKRGSLAQGFLELRVEVGHEQDVEGRHVGRSRRGVGQRVDPGVLAPDVDDVAVLGEAVQRLLQAFRQVDAVVEVVVVLGAVWMPRA